MIFRDKATGTLLNIRIDDFVNDRLYYNELIRIVGRKDETHHHKSSDTTGFRYSRPFHEVTGFTSEGPQYLKLE